MDIAYFISDLLGEQGELSVPNLGYFVQMRMNAYYNEQENIYYPPHYSVQFDPQVIDDDDSLASYITEKKKISLASAKYFIEKYITGLKEQALTDDVPFGNIGHFSSNGVQLIFTAGLKTDDPSFFAFQPLNVHKAGAAPVDVPVAVNRTADVADETPFATVQEQALPDVPAEIYEEEYEDERRRGLSVWLVLAIVLLVLVAAGGALYKFRPDLVNRFLPVLHRSKTQPAAMPAKHKDTLAKAPVIIAPDTAGNTSPADTLNKAGTVPGKSTSNKADTIALKSAKPPIIQQPAANGEVAKGSWLIYGGAYPTLSGANARIDILKGKGFAQARLLTGKVRRGGNFKIILGVYATRGQAIDASKELLATGKITPVEISVEHYK